MGGRIGGNLGPMSEHTPRPADTVPVRLVGGPLDWHGQVLDDMYTADDLAGPREELETYLPSDHVPRDHPDPGALALYAPDDAPARPDVWHFRRWVPDWPGSAERRRPAAVRELAVDTDDGLPAAVTDPARPGDRVRVVRVLAHWEHPAGGGRTDIWHVATRDGDMHLEHRPGRGWAGGALPAAPPAQEHADLLD